MIADRFISRPITGIVISIVIVLIGVLAIIRLPISQYPDITPPTVQVTGSFNGADAQTVEQTVTTPIESQINGTPGMAYMQGNSTSDGRTTINVTLNVGSNPDIVALDVQNRVGIATPQLPDDVKRLGLTTLLARGHTRRHLRGQLRQHFCQGRAAPRPGRGRRVFPG